MIRITRYLVTAAIFMAILSAALFCFWQLLHDPIVALLSPSEEIKKLIIFTGALGFMVSALAFVIVLLVIAIALSVSFAAAFFPAALTWRLLGEFDRSHSAIRSYTSKKWNADQ